MQSHSDGTKITELVFWRWENGQKGDEKRKWTREGSKARDNGKECGVEWMSKRQDLVGVKNILPKDQDKIKRKKEDGCLQLN